MPRKTPPSRPPSPITSKTTGSHVGSRRAISLLAGSTHRKSSTGSSSSAVFVLILSENANESIYVKREVERAVSKGKPVFPIRVREVMPSKSLELFISSAHWIDAWTPPIERYLERLAQSISAAAAVYPAGAPASAPARPTLARSWSAANQRRLPTAIAAALVLLLLGGAGWYAYGLLGRSGPRSPAVPEGAEAPQTSRTEMEAPTAQQVAPAAGRSRRTCSKPRCPRPLPRHPRPARPSCAREVW